MKICYFGIYDPLYSRNRILLTGLRENGCEITECRVDPRETTGFKKYVELYKKAHALRKEKFDIIFVAFPGQTVVWLAWLLFRQPIVFDAFLSLYDSNVFDRGLYKPWSFRAFKDYWWDWMSTQLARIIILDTFEHITYFTQAFHVAKHKFIRVPVGAQQDIFYPQENKTNSDKYTLYFHGNFIPLQGALYIVKAAEILRNERIIFTLVGTGQDFDIVQKFVREKKLENIVHLEGRKTIGELAEYIKTADICLGIFGNTKKTKRVIPNKVYEYAAMSKAIITADTPAIRELFTDQKNILLCNVADSADLAQKIMMLKKNSTLKNSIEKNGGVLFKDRCSADILIKEFMHEVQKRLKK